jgi:hypothetical protein
MSKDFIQINGEDAVVREDTAKAFNGVHWALVSIVGFVLITGVLFFFFLWGATRDGSIENPANIQSSNSHTAGSSGSPSY